MEGWPEGWPKHSSIDFLHISRCADLVLFKNSDHHITLSMFKKQCSFDHLHSSSIFTMNHPGTLVWEEAIHS